MADHVAAQTSQIWRTIDALRLNRLTTRDAQERTDLRDTLRVCMRFAETPALKKRAADALREDDRLHREAERQCASSA